MTFFNTYEILTREFSAGCRQTRFKRDGRILVAGLLLACLIGCDVVPGTEAGKPADAEKMKAVTIATWNIQALFDGE
jgi:hypothetical protein